MKKIRIAVSGLGRIGWHFHCPSIAESDRFELAGACDPLRERRAEAEQHFGCATYADFDRMIQAPGLEAVVVASPTHLHQAQACAALRRGLHVLLEKPMAADLAQAEAVLRLARKRGRVLTVYQPHRAMAYYQHFRKLVQAGTIGRVYHVRRGWFAYTVRDDWQGLRRYGGGMLNNYGSHALDQVLSLTGGKVRRLFAQARRVASLGDAEDVVKVVYETTDGMLGEVDINQASASNPYMLEAWGTLGTMGATDSTITVRRVKDGRLPAAMLQRGLASAGRRYPEVCPEIVTEEIPVDGVLAVDVYENLFQAIRRGKPLLVRPEETLAVMRMIARCREQARVLSTPAPRAGKGR